jgi:AraC-like DNA-binding protein
VPIVAWIDSLSEVTFRSALKRDTVYVAATLAEFALSVSRESNTIVAVDPELCTPERGAAHEGSLAALLAIAAPGVPVVVFSKPSRDVLRNLIAIARHHPTEFVHRGLGDERKQIVYAIANLRRWDTTSQLLNRIISTTDLLPRPIAHALELTLREAEGVMRTADLQPWSGVSERTIDRWLRRVGLRAPRHFIEAGRLISAYRILRHSAASIACAAEATGYASAIELRFASRRTLGCSPRFLRVIGDDDFVTRLAGHLRPALEDRGQIRCSNGAVVGHVW